MIPAWTRVIILNKTIFEMLKKSGDMAYSNELQEWVIRELGGLCVIRPDEPIKS